LYHPNWWRWRRERSRTAIGNGAMPLGKRPDCRSGRLQNHLDSSTEVDMKTGTRPTLRALLTALVLTGILALSQAGAQEALNVTLNQNVAVIDPTANWLYDLTANQFVPLVGYDSVSGETEPAGAVSWSVSDDGLTYTFNIRE